MKNFSLWLNAILLIAVIFLYYKIYSEKSIVQDSSASNISLPEASIVYVNSDSLLDNYPYFTEIKNVFGKTQDSIENILKTRGKLLENEIKSYQENGASLTEEQRQSMEESLSKKQQDFLRYKEELTDDLARAEEKLNTSLHTNLINVLKKINKNKNYHFILGYQKGSGILLANDSLDITKQIIQELNKEKSEK